MLEGFLRWLKSVLVRGPVFEARKDGSGKWYVRKIAANGQIESHTQPYASKASAKRSVKKHAANTPFATWRVMD